MKLDIVAGSGNDEFYTPEYAVKPILPYIPQGAIVWCPFDTEDSNFVKMIKDRGHTVVNTHISNGDDFFNCDVPSGCTHIISNPPYSMKNEVFERLFDIGLPFAMLVGVVGIFESKRRFNLFKNNEFEIMYFDKRVSYLRSYSDIKPALNPPFSSVYLCSQMLDSKIVFTEIEK